jgi:hypothetical protein
VQVTSTEFIPSSRATEGLIKQKLYCRVSKKNAKSREIIDFIRLVTKLICDGDPLRIQEEVFIQ